MSVSFTLPIKGFRRLATNNDGSSSADNTNAVSLTGFVNSPDNSARTIIIPAGAAIYRISAVWTGASVDAAATVTIATSTGISYTSGAIGASTRFVDHTAGFAAAAAANAQFLANVGTSDVTITFTETSAVGPQAQTFFVEYIGRNADGTIYSAGANTTNN